MSPKNVQPSPDGAASETAPAATDQLLKGGLMYQVLKRVVLGPIVWLWGKNPEVEGLENIPAEGAVILASNHQSIGDWLYLPLKVDRRITFLAKSDYFTGTGIKGAFMRWFFGSVGQVPLDRSGANAAEAALLTARRILAQGQILGLYPEGTRTPDGRLHRGKTGVARIALDTGVPVIPVAVKGTYDWFRPGTKIPKRTKIKVIIGEPLDLSRFDGLAGDRFIERAVTDEIMYTLMRMSGQQYVDYYGADVKYKKVDPTSVPIDPNAWIG